MTCNTHTEDCEFYKSYESEHAKSCGNKQYSASDDPVTFCVAGVRMIAKSLTQEANSDSPLDGAMSRQPPTWALYTLDSWRRAEILRIMQGSGTEPAVPLRLRHAWSSDLGFVPNDPSVDHAPIIAAAAAEVMATGVKLLVEPGEYSVHTPSVVQIGEDKTLDIELMAGAKLKASTSLTKPVLAVNGAAGKNSSLKVVGPGTIDASEGIYVVGAQSATGLEVNNMHLAEIESVKFYAGDNYKENKGDSGITGINNELITVHKCHFQGWPDAGVYLGGGALLNDESDDGYSYHISENVFLRCKNDATIKRQNRSGTFTENFSTGSEMGFTLFGAASGTTNLPGGINNVVANNVFDGTARPISLRTTKNAVVTGNIIRRWGKTFDGVDHTHYLRAVLIEGCVGANITGNTIDATITNPDYAIENRDYTFDGILYEGGGSRIDNTHVGTTATVVYADKTASKSSHVTATGSGLGFNAAAMNANTFLTLVDTAANTKEEYKGQSLLSVA